MLGSVPSNSASLGCSRTGDCRSPLKVDLWEPDDGRPSRRVLRAGGCDPPRPLTKIHNIRDYLIARDRNRSRASWEPPGSAPKAWPLDARRTCPPALAVGDMPVDVRRRVLVAVAHRTAHDGNAPTMAAAELGRQAVAPVRVAGVVRRPGPARGECRLGDASGDGEPS